MNGKCLLKVAIHHGNGVPEERLNKIHASAHFVGNGQFFGAGTVGQPERGNHCSQFVFSVLFLVGIKPILPKQVEECSDAFGLGENGAAAGFGWMSS